jgi:diguanylate cyclase (GGDEF)-like protein
MEKIENILIVDDDKILCEHLKAGLDDTEYGVTAVSRASDAIDAIKKKKFNLVLMDLVLPDIQGSALMRTMSNHSPETSFIVFTGFATISSAIEALKIGAYDYIMKPFDIDHLKLVIKRGLEKQRLTVKNRELIERLEKEKVKLEIILDAYNKIGSIFNLDELSDFVTARAMQIVEAERSSLLVLDEKTGELVLTGGHGIGREKLRILRVRLGEMISGWVAMEGQALLVKDVDTDPRVKRSQKASYKTRSFISLPLKSDKHVLGVINVTDKIAAAHVFTDDDLKYLQLLAHQTVTQIENIRLCERLSSLAVTDSLTGVFNHRYFQEQLNHEMLRSRRYGEKLSLIIFDIDAFKSYNDKYGHLEGDMVLKQVAETAVRCTRKVDMVCRYGGDEFIVLLPSTGPAGAKAVAEKIRASIEGIEIMLKGNKRFIKVTISGGVAAYKEGMDRDELLNAADRLMYKAKSAGGNSVCGPD